MENSLQIQQIELFLEEVIIRELGKMQEIEISYMPFVLMGQAIEVLGGFLDNKPMKAKGQSSRRFSNSVNRLFGGRYRMLDRKSTRLNSSLYDKLRNQMTHTFIPGGDLLLLNHADPAGRYQHLQYSGGKLVLIADVFYQDICQACRRLVNHLKEGRIKPKNIAFENEG